MTKSLTVLVAGTLVVWLVVFYPAQLLGGETALVFSAVAGLVCLVPAAATLVWGRWARKGPPELQLAAVMGGMGVRMAVVLGIGMALFFLVPYFQHASFLLWVVVFYLITLSLEVGLLLAHPLPVDRSQNH